MFLCFQKEHYKSTIAIAEMQTKIKHDCGFCTQTRNFHYYLCIVLGFNNYERHLISY